jgi:hypothetical protein
MKEGREGGREEDTYGYISELFFFLLKKLPPNETKPNNIRIQVIRFGISYSK